MSFQIKRLIFFSILILCFVFGISAQAASITLSPNSGFSTVTILGNGFFPGETITVYWDGLSLPIVPYGLTVDGSGNFTAIISVPEQADVGQHIIRAEDDSGNGSASTFEVIDMRGSRGLKGERGSQGEQGLQGEQGPSGEQGPQGETGPSGPQGNSGPQGLKGEQGSSGAGFSQEDLIKIQEFLEKQESLEGQESTKEQGLSASLIISIIAIFLALISLGLILFRKFLSKNP